MQSYACTTDYKSLYAPTYFGKSAGATSFVPDTFTKELLAFCSARRIRHVVDVGSGSGALAAILRRDNIEVITCDFDPVDADGIHFDLSGPVSGAMRVLDAVKKKTTGESWLVTCLDVLEHLDIEDVFAAVRNLKAVCPVDRSHLIVSISTRPSSADYKFHATILPKPTWLEILKTVGFVVDQESIFESARTVRQEFPEVDELKLVSYWAKCDIFRDIGGGEPDYVLLSSGADSTASKDVAQRHIEEVLDIAYRREKRSMFNAGLVTHKNGDTPPPRLALNLHHLQEFILFRPLLDVLPRDSVTVLIRTSVLDPYVLSMVRGFLARCGVQAIFYERCSEIPWSKLNLQFLITGAESNVAYSHILGRQTVEAAKLHGVYTIQMQHGIWLEQFPERVIEFGSEKVLAWSAQYENFIRGSQVNLAGSMQHGLHRSWQSFDVFGSPKFVDMQLCPPRELLRWRLGLDTSRHRTVALLGTNLMWNRHAADAKSIRERLVDMMQSTPDVFFVLKLHPSERAADAVELARSNSLVLDDLLMGMLDLHVSRLIAAVDVVISSLSTLLLDGAIGGKPCLQYNTNNDLAYHGLASVEIEQLPELLMNIATMPVNSELVQKYASPIVEPFYEHLARILTTHVCSTESKAETQKDAVSYYSVATEVEDRWEQLRDIQRVEQVSARKAQRYQNELAVVSHQNSILNVDLETLKIELDMVRSVAKLQEHQLQHTEAELAALKQSNSWRLTSPLRSWRRFLGV